MNRNSAWFFKRLLVFLRPWWFPLGVACLYGIGLLTAPESTARSVYLAGSMSRRLVLPICLVLVVMVGFNRLVSPAAVARFLGRSAGVKGVLLSSLAGVVSMGPIYAWYPLFKTLRDKGASAFHIATFMGCRSIKPALLPVLVGYFGWEFASVFVAFCLVGALTAAGIVAVACPPASGEDRAA